MSSIFLFILPLTVGTLVRAAMWLSPKSFWGDEWFSIHAAGAPTLAETVRISIADVHPPLYYMLLRWVSELGGGSEAAWRALSFAAGTAMLWTLGSIARRHLSPFAASACLWMTAVSPYWLQSANEVRSYALMAFCVTASAAAFLRMTDVAEPVSGGVPAAGPPQARRPGLIGAFYVFFAVAAVYVEHYSWFWLAASSAYIFFQGLRNRRIPRGAAWVAAAVVLALPSLVLIAYQAAGGEQMFVVSRVQEYWNPAWMAKKIVGIFWHFSSGYEFAMLTVDRIARYAATSPYFWACAAAAGGGGVLFLTGAAALRRERPALFWCLVTAFLAPLVFLWIFYPIRLHARYLSFAAPWFFIGVAAGLGRLPRALGRPALAFFVAIGAWGSYQSVVSVTDRVHRQDYRGQIRYILENAGPDDVIVGYKPQYHYYRKALGLSFEGRYFEDLAQLDPQAVKGAPRIWVPDIHNMHPEVTARNLEIIEGPIAALGYRRAAGPIYFGGEGAMTLLYVFERDLT